MTRPPTMSDRGTTASYTRPCSSYSNTILRNWRGGGASSTRCCLTRTPKKIQLAHYHAELFVDTEELVVVLCWRSGECGRILGLDGLAAAAVLVYTARDPGPRLPRR